MTESKVDVLLLLDDVATWKGEFMGDFFSASEVRLARAAVAELIEAVAEKFAADDDKHARGYRTVGMDLRSMTADDRLRAALAACTPAKSEGR